MKEKSIYCINCDGNVNYITKKETKKVIVKGREFEVTLTRAYCAKCGEPLSPDEIAKENDLIVYDEYRRLEGLLTSDQIKAIREKRHLSQVGLAKLINCGEKNIARYETGTIQDRAFDLLMRLVDNDASYAVLEKQQAKQEKIFSFVLVSIEGFESKARSLDWTALFDTECEFDYKKGGTQNGHRIKTQQILCH